MLLNLRNQVAILLLEKQLILTHVVCKGGHWTDWSTILILVFILNLFVHDHSGLDGHCPRSEQERGVRLIVMHHRGTNTGANRRLAISSQTLA